MVTSETYQGFLQQVISDDELHARWLNTLSLLENCGARKISAGQDPQRTTEAILRHAFEESRHAWYLKRQISKLAGHDCPTYEPRYLLAAQPSKHYLNKLDVEVARLVKSKLGLTGQQLRDACYLLVTYAIEVKADRLYGVYEQELEAADSEVSVRSILLEEESHLSQMTEAIEDKFDETQWWLASCLEIEEAIHAEWFSAVVAEVAVGERQVASKAVVDVGT